MGAWAFGGWRRKIDKKGVRQCWEGCRWEKLGYGTGLKTLGRDDRICLNVGVEVGRGKERCSEPGGSATELKLLPIVVPLDWARTVPVWAASFIEGGKPKRNGA